MAQDAFRLQHRLEYLLGCHMHRPIRRPLRLALCTFACAIASFAAAAQDAPESLDESLQRCLAASGPNVVVTASCSAAIDSNRLTPKGLAAALVVRASAFSDSERPDLGLPDADRALAIDPTLLLAHSVRADLRAKFRDYHGAIEDLDAVLAKVPDDTPTLRRRATFRDWIGDHQAAIDDFNASLQIKPDASAYSGRAIAYKEGGDPDRAMQDVAKAMEIAPDDPTVIYERAQLRFKSGDFAGAASDFATAADDPKSDAYVVIWAYLAAVRSGAPNAAKDLAKRAERLASNDNAKDWPGQIIELYLGHREPGAVSPPNGGHIPWMTDGYRCEADFYVAEYYLMKGDIAAARPLFEAAANSKIAEFIEPGNARDELARLDR
jgi:lipoprotein NlpI